MKIGPFGKGKPEKKEGAVAAKAADLEKQLGGWTDNLKQSEQRLKKLTERVKETGSNTAEPAQKISLDAEPVRPHGPIGELSLDSAAESAEDESQPEGEELEVIKMTEAKPEAQTAPPPEDNSQKAGGLSDASFKDLFTTEDEDENPLANLVKSLPDVTVDELEEDLKEIKDIIKDWQKK